MVSGAFWHRNHFVYSGNHQAHKFLNQFFIAG
jgi:hypothetical protein